MKPFLRSIRVKHSALCVGLDPVPGKVAENELARFGEKVVDATAPYAAAYKMQFAFYECRGIAGLKALEKTLEYIRRKCPGTPVIADAKRCDISSTAAAYAQSIFDHWGFDSATLVPYMGEDGILPFLEYADKSVFLVCHTSNKSSAWLQTARLAEGDITVFERVSDLVLKLGGDRAGLVMGATYPAALGTVRRRHPQVFILSPGVGAQGGNMAATVKAGLDASGGRLLINASRSIAFAADPADEARKLRDSINRHIISASSTWKT